MYKLFAVTAVGMQYRKQMYSNERSCAVAGMSMQYREWHILINEGGYSVSGTGVQYTAQEIFSNRCRYAVLDSDVQYRARMCSNGRGN